MAERPLELTRQQILAFRHRVAGLERRVPAGADALRAAAWAGLQDSMPRAAVLSIHARLDDTAHDAWEHPSLVQLWGPRFSAYVVDERDRAVFTLGRMPDDPRRRHEFEDVADRLEAFLDGRQMKYGEAGRGLGVNPNALRYAAPTGRVVMRWDGARQPTIWMVPAPAVDPFEARLELARRHLHVFGPTNAQAFSDWAGIKPPRARAAYDALGASLTPVRTPIGEAWILRDDEAAIRAAAKGKAATTARLLPSGDTYYLLQGADRELVVPDPVRRTELWTSRVWPGAVLVGTEIVGTWRRAGPVVTIEAWRDLPPAARQAIDQEAQSFPLPDVQGRIRVTWS